MEDAAKRSTCRSAARLEQRRSDRRRRAAGERELQWIGAGYFRTMGAPLLAGRDINERDTATSPRSAIVTESFARMFFGGQNPFGKTFQIDEPPARRGRSTRLSASQETRSTAICAIRSSRWCTCRPAQNEPPGSTLRRGDAIARCRSRKRRRRSRRSPASPPVDRRAIPDDAIAGAGFADARTADGDAVGVLRRAGGVDCDDRPLRRHVVHGGAPPQRNRHSDGARRRPARRWSGW